jgi:hypothetical protein
VGSEMCIRDSGSVVCSKRGYHTTSTSTNHSLESLLSSLTHRFKMGRTMTSIYALALFALIHTAGATDVTNVKATVNKAMARMKQVSVKTIDTRRSLVMTSATSSYTAPDKCSEQLTALRTMYTTCGIELEEILEEMSAAVENIYDEICSTTSYTCRKAFMKYYNDYPSYANGGVCDACRHHDDCVSDGYCFDGECYAPGCTSDSECTAASSSYGTCDPASSKCYEDDLEELDLNKGADMLTDEDVTLTCMYMYPGYTYGASAAALAPLTLFMTAVLLSVATTLLL